ncbi:MAG: hypothetical protein RIB86_00635, partial [Imperialibacter sp.]
MYSRHIVAFIDILGFKDLIGTRSFGEVNSIYDEFRKIGEEMDVHFRSNIYSFKHHKGYGGEERFSFSPDLKKL